MDSGIKLDDEFLKNVWEIGKKYGVRILPVGGLVRDFFLNRRIADYDFLVLSDDENALKSFVDHLSSSSGLTVVKPARFDTYRLVKRELTIDLSVLKKGEHLESNLVSRDLTINSIAYSFDDNLLLDPSNGLKDIKKGILRTFSGENFKQDPLRVLRLFRFFATFEGFKIEEKTRNYAFEYSYLLNKVSRERIRDEIFKIFRSDRGFMALKSMIFPVLSTVFPSLEDLKGVPQNGYHHLDVLDHTLEVVSFCFDLDWFKERFSFFPLNLSDDERVVLRFSALFHDTGKKDTMGYNAHGVTTFKNHQFVSASKVLNDLSFFPKKMVERIYLLIRRHMLFLNFMINGYSEKSFGKLINMMREDSILLLILFLADKKAARGPLSKGSLKKALNIANDFLNFYLKEKDRILKLPKLISGYDVIKILEIAPSRKVGEVLNMITEKQLEDPEFSREEALKLLYSLKGEM